MNYLLDTCVLSEFTHRKPEEKVLRWLDEIPEEKLFISAITIGEIQRGIERLNPSHRKTELLVWMNNALTLRFNQRIIALDAQTMLIWGSLTGQMELSGHSMPLMDSLIAATALQHRFILATRNTADFNSCEGIQLINPWE